MSKKNIERDKGRVTAFQLNRYIREKNTIKTVYLPQFELIEYDSASGDVIGTPHFVCFQDENTISGCVEFDNEVDALKNAVELRDKLNVN
jgi:hypothetical protein